MSTDNITRKSQRSAVRTAWVLGAIALVVYGAFLLSGVIGR